ncbi:MAG: hypothetical protein ACRED2_04560, partial [Methylocella sp.]
MRKAQIEAKWSTMLPWDLKTRFVLRRAEDPIVAHYNRALSWCIMVRHRYQRNHGASWCGIGTNEIMVHHGAASVPT